MCKPKKPDFFISLPLFFLKSLSVSFFFFFPESYRLISDFTFTFCGWMSVPDKVIIAHSFENYKKYDDYYFLFGLKCWQ